MIQSHPTKKNKIASPMSDKAIYREKSLLEATIPLFSRPWWLDAVCGDNGWDVVILLKDGKLIASLPFVLKSKFGIKIITTPAFTQFLGIWIAGSSAKYAKRLGQEKEIINKILEKLPQHSIFFQCFSSEVQNWLPFFWKGFEQTTKYTYRINDLSNLEAVWSETNANIKTDVRKARKSLRIHYDRPVSDLYEVLEMTYARQSAKCPFSFEALNRLCAAAFLHDSGKILCAVDDSDNIHGAALVVWDENTAYYLAGGANPELRNSGVGSFCVWSAIELSSEVSRAFDFEGSMVEGIERFFRGFGGVQVPYFRLRRFSHPLFSLAYSYKSRISKKI